jgi:hypothetical protein
VLAVPPGCHDLHGVPGGVEGMDCRPTLLTKHENSAERCSRRQDMSCSRFASGRSAVAHDVSVGDGGAKYPLPQSRLLGLVVKVAGTPDPIQGVYVRR